MAKDKRTPVLLTDDEQKRALHTQLRALDPWRKIRQTMPLQYLYTFLLVAVYEGKSVQEYADLAGVAQTVMSRHLMDLGSRNRHMEPGWGLVEAEADKMNLRRHVIGLTPRGKAFARELAEILAEG